MNKEKYYFSILIQDAGLIEEIDMMRKAHEDDENFNPCQCVCDLLCGVGYEDDKDNFTPYEPYICKGSDFVVSTYQEYILVRNLAICGDYMIYREATEEENEWLNENK